MFEHAFRLLLADSHRHFDRRIGQLEEMRGMQFAVMTEAFGSDNQ